MRSKTLLILGLLLFTAFGRCFGYYGIAEVSKAQATELGVTIQAEKNGEAGIRVQMEFKTDGKLKQFGHVEVRMGEGKDRIMSAPLREYPRGAGRMAVMFSADPAYLSRSKLWIYVHDAPLGGTIYQFKVSDFIEPEQLR